MQLTARLSLLLPAQTGTGKNGVWKKQEFVVETDGQYPKKVCISAWGDKADPAVLVPGRMLKIDFDLESREYNGRWYTEAKAWKIELADGNASGGGYVGGNTPQTPPDQIHPEFKGDVDDLPF
jgi:hypothetical protein